MRKLKKMLILFSFRVFCFAISVNISKFADIKSFSLKIMRDIIDFFKLMLAISIPAFLICFVIYRCTYANHNVTESSPNPNLELVDIQYKGHTYIYVSGTYSHTIVHAEHCKCHSVKK